MPTHVLAVDDDPLILRLVQLNLQRGGYRVSTAADGEDGLAKIAEERPDLVVLDINMPRLDGIEMLRRLRADSATADLPVILLTARSQDADIHEAWRSGANCYLPKPFHPAQLLSAVEETLKGRGNP